MSNGSMLVSTDEKKINKIFIFNKKKRYLYNKSPGKRRYFKLKGSNITFVIFLKTYKY